MRISEIKQTITDEKVLHCIKNDFWEDELYRKPLEKEKSLHDTDAIYLVIKNTYLNLLECSENRYSLTNHNKKIRRLSKLIYGDSAYWAKNTSWEATETKRKEKILINEKNKNISFLYKRLGLKKTNNNFDIVHLISKSDDFYDEILKCETLQSPINNINELYEHYESLALRLLNVRKLTYTEYRIMKSVSYLAFHDSERFFIRNELETQSIVQE